MYFNRSVGPLLSVILPSRQRIKELTETINSFIELADNPNNVEFLVKLDTDDETNQIIRNIPGKTKTIVSDRLRGYHDLHLFVNDLCKIAQGDWLLLMNDDAKMVTKGWDTILENINPLLFNSSFKGNSDVCLLNPGSPESDRTDVFPMIRKNGFNAVGHFSLHPHNDTWVQYIYGPVNSIIFCPEIKIKHYNNEIKDETRNHSANAQNTSFRDWHNFSELRAKDVEILKKLIGV